MPAGPGWVRALCQIRTGGADWWQAGVGSWRGQLGLEGVVGQVRRTGGRSKISHVIPIRTVRLRLFNWIQISVYCKKTNIAE